MFEYNSKYCILGMMSAKTVPSPDWKWFKKNRTTAVCFDANFKPDFPKVSYSYIYNKPPKPIKSYKSTQLTSKLDAGFFDLSGKKYQEIRETRNHFDRIITTRDYNKQDVLDLIDFWDTHTGKPKYKWQLHSGYDRNFFNIWYDQEKDNLFSRFYYIEDRMVGYSILHKGVDCWEYLLRKADNTLRNTCLYIDYKTFESIYQQEQRDFFVCWGSSKGSLLIYKRKFGSYDERPTYFYKIGG